VALVVHDSSGGGTGTIPFSVEGIATVTGTGIEVQLS
jgi:hypothetical protein